MLVFPHFFRDYSGSLINKKSNRLKEYIYIVINPSESLKQTSDFFYILAKGELLNYLPQTLLIVPLLNCHSSSIVSC